MSDKVTILLVTVVRLSCMTERRNLPKDTILEDVMTNSSELLQTVNDLKTEMESVKKENERILRAQE